MKPSEQKQTLKGTHKHSPSCLSQMCIFYTVPGDKPTSACSIDSMKASRPLSVLTAGPANGSLLWLFWNETKTSLRTSSHSPASQYTTENIQISKSCLVVLSNITSRGWLASIKILLIRLIRTNSGMGCFTLRFHQMV